MEFVWCCGFNKLLCDKWNDNQPQAYYKLHPGIKMKLIIVDEIWYDRYTKRKLN